MNEHEQHIDNILKTFVEVDKLRRANLRSLGMRSLFMHDKGDRISLELTGIHIDGVQLEEDHRVEGILLDPNSAIIRAQYVEGDTLQHWKENDIGLATCYEMRHFGKAPYHQVYPHKLAGNGQAAYFYAKDMDYHDSKSQRTVADKDIHILAMKYGRLAINGLDYINFS
jgi:Zn ribbon nucleic-acid-binding protein